MIKLVDLLSEFPMKVDNATTIPELMKSVLAMPTLNSKEMLNATSKINEEGLYFWYLSPEGAKRWEKVLSLTTGKPQSVSYCKTNDEGNYLVYVGLAASPSKKKGGLNSRLNGHIGSDNPRASSLRNKIFQVLFPSVDVGDDFTIYKKNIQHGGGQWHTKYKAEYDKFIAENFRFNFLKASDLDLDKDISVKDAIHQIEVNFIESCVLHFNKASVPDKFLQFSLDKISPSKPIIRKKYNP